MKKILVIILASIGTLSFANDGETAITTVTKNNLAGTELFLNTEKFNLSDIAISQNEDGENALFIDGKEVDLSKDVITVTGLNFASFSGGSCPGDFNEDGHVTVADLTYLLGHMGTNCSDISDCCPDMNGDGVVNVNDLSGFLGVFGTSC